jgi:hypothetical protein
MTVSLMITTRNRIGEPRRARRALQQLKPAQLGNDKASMFC